MSFTSDTVLYAAQLNTAFANTLNLTTTTPQSVASPLVPAALYHPINNIGSVDADLTIDVTTNQFSTLTLNADINLTVNFTATTETPVFTAALFAITQGTDAPFTITWPDRFAWQGGYSPALSTGAGATDVVQIISFDSGTNWFAAIALQMPA